MKRPSRCPVCSSRRLSTPSFHKSCQQGGSKDDSDLESVYELLARLSLLSTDEQEEVRRRLVSEGVHILVVDFRRGGLEEVLGAEEAKRYLSLVEERGYRLAIVGNAIVAVSPSSNLAAHIGLSQRLLDMLKRAAGRGGGS